MATEKSKLSFELGVVKNELVQPVRTHGPPTTHFIHSIYEERRYETINYLHTNDILKQQNSIGTL
jgi:hypothetical protein